MKSFFQNVLFVWKSIELPDFYVNEKGAHHAVANKPPADSPKV